MILVTNLTQEARRTVFSMRRAVQRRPAHLEDTKAPQGRVDKSFVVAA